MPRLSFGVYHLSYFFRKIARLWEVHILLDTLISVQSMHSAAIQFHHRFEEYLQNDLFQDFILRTAMVGTGMFRTREFRDQHIIGLVCAEVGTRRRRG